MATRMIRQPGLLLISSVLVLSGCIDPIESPPCTATTLTQASLSGDTITLNTGLRYIEGAPGEGRAAEFCRSLATHYTGYLLDGTRLESSHDFDQPLIFTPGLGDLIDGFEQGVIGMRTAGSRRLIVPPHLAYGAQEQRNSAGEIVVPANSTLVYDLEIVAISQ
ncbi:MAG TPA: FKBP-type peptidyl-prolyl cis-trans isomerase [Gemmatimonadaceae bacterium]|nr:FKBP-type peptidyl-prolyl cis-trans isomerase [Gemmatimonadaceae bacterium]